VKTALCLSGQARSIEENFSNIKNTILDKNDVDVFVHTWFDEDDVGKRFNNVPAYSKTHDITFNATLKSNTASLIENLYSPKKILIEKQKCFIDKELIHRADEIAGTHPENPYKNRWYIRPQYCFSMFYSIMKANQLKKDFELELGKNYDCVVRYRFDMHFGGTPLEFNMYDMNCMHIMRHSHCSYSYQDTFAFSSSKNMDFYADTFNYIDEYFKKGVEFCPEILLGHRLVTSNIKIQQIHYPYHIVR
jgi:hypothetical protein